MSYPKISARKSPYYSNAIGSVGFTIGSESADAITVAVQLKDARGSDLAVRGHLRAYFAGDANGDTLAAVGPSGGVRNGTDGLITPRPDTADALVVAGTLAVSATAEKFKTTTTAVYRIAGVTYTKAATDNLVFSAGHIVAATKYGVVLVQINAAGTVSTKVPGATQSYNTANLALAALPSPDAGNAALGYITLDNSGSDGSSTGAWTANTDDLTDTGDITAAGFVDGTVVNTPRAFDMISEADGDVDLVITHSGAATFRVAVQLPDGTIQVSDAITFAA